MFYNGRAPKLSSIVFRRTNPKEEIRMEKMRKGRGPADLDTQLNQWMAVAGNEAEQLCALQRFLEAGIRLPAEGQVIGGPVSVISWEDTQGESNGR